jgi:hypothetical protein
MFSLDQLIVKYKFFLFYVRFDIALNKVASTTPIRQQQRDAREDLHERSMTL